MFSLVCNKIETSQQLQPTLKTSGSKVGAASTVGASRKSQGQQDVVTAQFIFRTLKQREWQLILIPVLLTFL